MLLYTHVIRPLLFARWDDPEDAHEWALNVLKQLGHSVLADSIEALLRVRSQSLSQELFDGLHFDNPVGLAAGFDKDGIAFEGEQMCGFSHVELGTVTYDGQQGNPRQRMFRYLRQLALRNKMGFNNGGADRLANRVLSIHDRRIPIGISIGKNARVDPNDPDAVIANYGAALRVVQSAADYIAVNVSSPNTEQLREWQHRLDGLLEELQHTNHSHGYSVGTLQPRHSSLDYRHEGIKPLLVKIGPDLSFAEIDSIAQVCADRGIAGIIATNTTTDHRSIGLSEQGDGGLSGAPLFEKSRRVVSYLRRQDPKLVIVGVGGISDPARAWDMLAGAGANLIQVYTALPFEGPTFPRDINRHLVRQLRSRRIPNIISLRG